MQFENDVKMYGIQTTWMLRRSAGRFENDVKMYGIQTAMCAEILETGLRMM